jgi:electron transfer flavoprotein beta subunit
MLKIAVCIKQVPDPLSVEIDPLSGAINSERLAYIINPPDLESVELALRWRDKFGGEVHVVSAGPERVEKALRDCLALGVDSVTRLEPARTMESSPSQTARALAEVIKPLGVDLVLCGARSADNGSGQVPAMLAERLDLAQVTSVVAATLEIEGENGPALQVERKLERGKRERLRVSLPALLALEPGMVEPRYAALPAYMAAQQATIPVVRPANQTRREAPVRLVEIRPPRPRPHQIFIPDPDLPAAVRIQAILSGGTDSTAAKKGSPVEGSPEEQADRIIDFLEKRGFLD